MVTVGYIWLQWVKYSYSVTDCYSGLRMVTVGYLWLHWVTYSYFRLYMVTSGGNL